MPYSKALSPAFSTLELLCVIIILGILASVGFSYMGNLSHKQCIHILKSKLQGTQSALSSYYANSFVKAVPIRQDDALAILKRLESSNKPTCALRLESSHIVAIVGSDVLHFSIEPSNLSINPKISCILTHKLCKAFSDRILDK